MNSLLHHFAGWSLRTLCFVPILQGMWLLPKCWEACRHAPVEGGIVLGVLLCLLAGFFGIFWRRGSMLIRTAVPFPIAVIWLTLRAFYDALAAIFLALGLVVCLLLLFGGDVAQESMLNVSLASHITRTNVIGSALVNWTLHSCVATLFYSSGLRVDDALDHLRKEQVPA